ncbi:MAG TPA: hypothetical protein VGV35_08930 [Bryobacteraceae bacterium]|nr:hypothetical protein [Bryobacteraceae bacterium]
MFKRIATLAAEWKALLCLLALAILVAIAEWIGQAVRGVSILGWLFQQPFFWCSVVFGVLTGAAEIIARYRDEPFAATFSPPGLIYMVLNGAISGAAYGVLAR